MWICEKCETYNQDDHAACRICGADKSVVKIENAVQTMTARLEEKPVIQTKPETTVAPLKPAAPKTAPAAAAPRRKPSWESSEPAPLTREIEHKKSVDLLARKRRSTRIALAIVNAGLFVANVVTILWITR